MVLPHDRPEIKIRLRGAKTYAFMTKGAVLLQEQQKGFKVGILTKVTGRSFLLWFRISVEFFTLFIYLVAPSQSSSHSLFTSRPDAINLPRKLRIYTLFITLVNIRGLVNQQVYH